MNISKAHYIASNVASPLFTKYDVAPIDIEVYWSHVMQGTFLAPSRIMVFLSDKTTNRDITETVRHEICHYIQWTHDWPLNERIAETFAKESG